MPASEAQRRATNKYLETLDDIKIRTKKGKRAVIQAHAAAQGESVNGFINRAIDETMERDGLERPTRNEEGAGGILIP